MIAALLPLLALALGDPQPIAPVSIGASVQSVSPYTSSVAPNGSGGWLAAWSTLDLRPTVNEQIVRIEKLDALGHPVATRVLPGDMPRIAATARGPMLLWHNGQNVFAARLDDSGNFATAPTQLPNGGTKTHLTCNATHCLAATGLSLTVIDADARIVSTATANAQPVALAADPEGFLLLEHEAATEAFVAERRNLAGNATFIAQMGPRQGDAVGVDFDGADYTVVTMFWSVEARGLRAVKLSPYGTLGTARDVFSWTTGYENGASLAWNGAEHLLVIADVTGGGGANLPDYSTIQPSTLRAVRLDRNLSPTGPPATISSMRWANGLPSVASSGDAFFVLWQHRGVGISARGARIVAGQKLSDEVVSGGAVHQELPEIGAAEERDLVIWKEADDAREKARLFYRRLPQDEQPRVLSEAYAISSNARIAAIGTDWLAAWTQSNAPAIGDYDERKQEVKAAIISPFTDEIQRFDLGISGRIDSVVAIANGWLVLLDDFRTFKTVRVTRAGQVLPAVDLGPAHGRAVLASNGENVLAAWPKDLNHVSLALLDANGQTIRSRTVDASANFEVAAIGSRGNFLVLGSPAPRVWNVAGDLSDVQEKVVAVPGIWYPPSLIPYDGGALATADTRALRLDADGNAIGKVEDIGGRIVAIASHGAEATVLELRKIEYAPRGTADQYFVRRLAEEEGPRRRRTTR